jgi:CDGSH-type Zn-finger protein
MADLNKLSKMKLEELGREYGIELDRRLTKSTLVAQLEEHINFCECGKTEDPNGVCDGSHATCEEKPEGMTKGQALKLAKSLNRKQGRKTKVLDNGDGTYSVRIK